MDINLSSPYYQKIEDIPSELFLYPNLVSFIEKEPFYSHLPFPSWLYLLFTAIFKWYHMMNEQEKIIFVLDSMLSFRNISLYNMNPCDMSDHFYVNIIVINRNKEKINVSTRKYPNVVVLLKDEEYKLIGIKENKDKILTYFDIRHPLIELLSHY